MEKIHVLVDTTEKPRHDSLCLLKQKAFLRAVKKDEDLGDHLRDAVNSLKIVLAADQSVQTGKTVLL